MGFEYLTNIPLAKAREDYLKLLTENGFGPKTEVIPVWDACGRVTAHAVYAHICAPHYAASAMDGVAVNARDTFGATETSPVTLNPGQFIVLDTGDPIPGGSDALILVEDIGKNDDGTILEVENAEVTVSFDGRLVSYPIELLGELEPAYAVTVHKAQGSEYRAVILSLYDVPPTLLARGVLYTAITRAKELFILVGSEELLAQMVANDRQTRRYSALRTRLLQESCG